MCIRDSAGTEDAVMMIEGFGDFLTTQEMLYAIEKGHEAVAKTQKTGFARVSLLSPACASYDAEEKR